MEIEFGGIDDIQCEELYWDDLEEHELNELAGDVAAEFEYNFEHDLDNGDYDAIQY